MLNPLRRIHKNGPFYSMLKAYRFKNIMLMYMYIQIDKKNTPGHYAFCDNDHTGIHYIGYVTKELCLK